MWFRKKSIQRCYEYTNIRNQIIKGNKKEADRKLFFYYDETDNCRKMRININSETGFNNSISSIFILGGIVSDKIVSTEKANELFGQLKINGKPAEIKYKTIFGRRSDFKNIMKSENLHIILKWLKENDLYVHFTEYSVIDNICNQIMESLSCSKEINQLEKDILKCLIIKESFGFAKLLDELEYPQIQNYGLFWIKLKKLFNIDELTKKEHSINSVEGLTLLIQQESLKSLQRKIELAYESKTRLASSYIPKEKGLILDNFGIVYQKPLIIFKNSMHYFDNETDIDKYLKDTPMFINGKFIKNYQFVNIKQPGELIVNENKVVYICDWIVRILQNTIQFLRNTSENKLYEYIQEMSKIEKDNFVNLCSLLRESMELNKFAFCFFDTWRLSARFEWLTEYEKTLILASISR